MKVVFLQKDSFVRLAISLLSSILKNNGHESDVFIESGERDFINAALKSKADLFAMSCATGSESWVIKTAEEIRKKCSTPIIVGGPHSTFYPQLIENPNIDYICQGEGEQALLELLDAMANNPQGIKEIQNIWSKDASGNIYKTGIRPLIEDLDKLPFSDFGLYSKYKYLTPYFKDMYPIISNRGCPYNCSYCFNNKYKELYKGKGKYLRRRSPQNVIQELLHVKNNYNITKVNIVDDSFLTHPSWLEEFADLYKKRINLPFIICLEASQVNEKRIHMIKEMGCICAKMGVETASDEMRKTVLNKKVTTQQIRDAAKLIKKYGIYLYTFNILGLPGETIDGAIDTYKLNKEIGSDFIWCSLMQAYPGTAINQYVKEHGFLEDENDESAFDEWYFMSSRIRLNNKNEITNLQKMMQFFIKMRIPTFWVRKIIRLPMNPIFTFLFKIEFAYHKMKVHKVGLIPTLKLAIHSLSFMRERSSN
jgi:radical SAM superfamily enzyme YgiQ (UPF0313 family)